MCGVWSLRLAPLGRICSLQTYNQLGADHFEVFDEQKVNGLNLDEKGGGRCF
jgi:hypothetical protein